MASYPSEYMAPVVAHYETRAVEYDQAAALFADAANLTPDFLRHLDAAEDVHWHAPAATAFRQALESERQRSRSDREEMLVLSDQVKLVAATMRERAAAARQLTLILRGAEVQAAVAAGVPGVGQAVERAMESLMYPTLFEHWHRETGGAPPEELCHLLPS